MANTLDCEGSCVHKTSLKIRKFGKLNFGHEKRVSSPVCEGSVDDTLRCMPGRTSQEKIRDEQTIDREPERRTFVYPRVCESTRRFLGSRCRPATRYCRNSVAHSNVDQSDFRFLPPVASFTIVLSTAAFLNLRPESDWHRRRREYSSRFT